MGDVRLVSGYQAFLERKATVAPVDGFEVDLTEIHPILKPHQRMIVQWAVRGGRRAIFAAFGVGKSVIQLETLRLVLTRAGGRALIVCPLGVQQEFAHDAQMIGLQVHRIRTTDEAQALPAGSIAITNYEPVRDGKLDPNVFTAVSLDEAAILRSFGSKTYQTFLSLFDGVPYRFVATATPSPNRFKELIHYSAFLGILDSGQALTRFFKRDSTQANNLTLLESQEANFWLWLATWSCWVQSPAELCSCDCHTAAATFPRCVCDTCSCGEYVLPELVVHEHELAIDHLARTNVERDGQTYLLADSAVSLPAAAREKRLTIALRIQRLLEILDGYGDDLDQVIVYCHLNEEQRAIERALYARRLPYSSVDGSMPTTEAERLLAEWKARETVVLVGKPVMLGVGLNLQQANKMVFVGIDYRFHDTIQAVHRIQRFGQARRCDVHLIFAESEREILAVLMAKWSQHEELTATMTDLIREHGLSRASVETALKRSLGVDRIEVSGDGWRLVNNDCVPEVQSMGSESVDLVVTSIPFANHYEYTPATEDFGFTRDNAHFWEQMEFLTPELLRVLSAGPDLLLPRQGPHRLRQRHRRRHPDKLAVSCGGADARDPPRLRLPRDDHRRHRRRPRERRHLPPRLVGAVQGRHEDGCRLPRVRPALPQAADRPIQGLRRRPGRASRRPSTRRARWQTDAHAFWRSSGDRLLSVDELAAMGPDRLAKIFTAES